MPFTHNPDFKCELCSGTTQMGGGVYEGRFIPQWQKILICRRCEASNWDGIIPEEHPLLMEKLRAGGIKLTRTEDGLVRIPPRGSVG